MNRSTSLQQAALLLGLSLAISVAAQGQVKPAPSAARPVAEAPAANRSMVTPAASAQATSKVFLKVVTARNETLKGEGNGISGYSAADGWMPVLSMHYDMTPRDTGTGAASGKRQHEPIIITKEWDSSSPRLMQAAEKGEPLREVTLVGIKSTKEGKEETYYTLHMTNAIVTSVKRVPSHGDHPSEEVTFEAATEDIQVKSGAGTPLELHQVPYHQQIAAPMKQ